MSTASITHRPIPLATAIAAAVAAAAFATVVVVQDNSSPAPADHPGQTSPVKHYPPLHGGSTQLGLP